MKKKGTNVTLGEINHELKPSGLATANLDRRGMLPIRYAQVLRVDPKRMVVDLKMLAGPRTKATNIPISFPGAGARHFFGAMPEVGDICLVGQTPTESGRSKTPVIIGWYVPSTQAGYDWLSVRSHPPDQLELTPKQKVALEGSGYERRHKLRQLEAGNIVASSAQGADLLLDESATLANRRGNEIILRDQDQAIVMRSLQQFHAGAGFRTYSGMVQRDANLLPTQIVRDVVRWDATRQVDESGVPLSPTALEPDDLAGLPDPSTVFDTDLITDGTTDPSDVLKRGLFMDAGGNLQLGEGKATYGGKPMYRVSTDLNNSIETPGVETFTEYRIEVAHTSTGILPVTEQTDGIDIDRMLPVTPPSDPDAEGGNQSGTTDPTALSPNASMVEFVLGTAVGNDSYLKPEEYGLPLVGKITTEGGERQTVIRAYDPASDTLQDQLAFLIRSRDPENPTRESFIGLTKGGAWLSNFSGQGSKVTQENLRTGKVSFYGADLDGYSRILNADGAVAINNTTGRPTDNVGVEIRSTGGAVEIFGGGANTAGASDGNPNPNSPSNAKTALALRSSKAALFTAGGDIKITSPEVNIVDTKTTNVAASGAVNVNSGDTISMSTKTLGMTVNGAAEYLFGGPTDSLPTNGASRSVKFTATPLTGAIGLPMDTYENIFGGRDEVFRMGRHKTQINLGSFNVNTMGPGLPAFGPGAGFSIGTGLPLLDNVLMATPANLSMLANIGPATVTSTKGPVVVTGVAGTLLNSAATVSMAAPFVHVLAPGLPGGVLTDGCLDSLTGRPFLLSGTMGAPGFRLN